MNNHPQYILRKAKNNQFYAILTASNGEPILTTEMYTRKHNLKRAIKSIKKNAAIAVVEEV